MMPKSSYLKITAEKSHCPDCKNTVDLIQDFFVRERLPMFYICWHCKKIWEVGHGEVERVK